MSTNVGGRVPLRAGSVWLVIGLSALPAMARYGGGLGTASQPYLIATAAQLNAVGSAPGDWDKCFKLTADIDMKSIGPAQLRPTGTTTDGPFTGVFDGNYKTISHLRLSSDSGNYLGLFGLVDAPEAQIANVTLLDPNVVGEAGRYVGALVGFFGNGTMVNCHVKGGRIRGMSMVGGLLGENMDGVVVDCTATTAVQGAFRVGGLVGENLFGELTRCQAAGAVSGETSSWSLGGLVGENQSGTVTACRACCRVQGDDRVGGLIGENIDGWADRCRADGEVRGNTDVGGLVGRNTAGKATDCYAVAAVTAVKQAGGLVGYNGPNCDCSVVHPSVVARCYAAGPVAAAEAGGLVARNYRSTVETSFWDLQATRCLTSDGGVGKTASQMYSLTTYTNAGWDFVAESKNGTKDIWYLPGPVNYPRLTWESLLADLNADGRVDFRDYARLAARWRQIDTGSWSAGQYTAPDGVVDWDDLANLGDQWLTRH